MRHLSAMACDRHQCEHADLALTLLFDSDQANDEQMTRESTGTSTATHPDASFRFDSTKAEVQSIYRTPLPDLLFRAQTIHRQFHPPDRVQTCQLISIKTIVCPLHCAYCPHSAHYDAD